MLYSYFKLIFEFACKSNIFFAHMQVISSFLLISSNFIRKSPYSPLIPYSLPLLVSFSLFTHIQLVSFSINHNKKSKPSHDLLAFAPFTPYTLHPTPRLRRPTPSLHRGPRKSMIFGESGGIGRPNNDGRWSMRSDCRKRVSSIKSMRLVLC